ncbi:MAG: hypothetical protein ACQER4_09145 [Bacteroidota bacterium]
MSEPNESEYKAWKEDVDFLIQTLKDLFESTDARAYVDDVQNQLYIELEGLHEYSHEEITEIAEPILSELDLDFEDIILLPLSEE